MNTAEIKKQAICEFIRAYESQKWQGKVKGVGEFGAEYLKGLKS